MSEDNIKSPINVDYFEDLTDKISLDRKSSSTGQCDQIGLRIQKIRKQKGISLIELSQLTGFDKVLLEEIEAGQVCPQLGTMIKLSKALDSALERLISNEGRLTYAITRRNQRKIISRTTSSHGQHPAYTYMSLAPEVKGRHMEALVVELEENADADRSVHAGEEFIYIIDGTVALSIGDAYFELAPGDSVYYLSTIAHRLSAKNGKAKLLAVIYSE